jgi:hypothetical protein
MDFSVDTLGFEKMVEAEAASGVVTERRPLSAPVWTIAVGIVASTASACNGEVAPVRAGESAEQPDQQA